MTTLRVTKVVRDPHQLGENNETEMILCQDRIHTTRETSSTFGNLVNIWRKDQLLCLSVSFQLSFFCRDIGLPGARAGAIEEFALAEKNHFHLLTLAKTIHFHPLTSAETIHFHAYPSTFCSKNQHSCYNNHLSETIKNHAWLEGRRVQEVPS